MVLSDETQRVRRHVTGHAELSAKSLVIHSPRPEYLIAPARAAIQHDNVKVRCAARGDRVPCLWRRVPACKGRKEEEENESAFASHGNRSIRSAGAAASSAPPHSPPASFEIVDLLEAGRVVC